MLISSTLSPVQKWLRWHIRHHLIWMRNAKWLNVMWCINADFSGLCVCMTACCMMFIIILHMQDRSATTSHLNLFKLHHIHMCEYSFPFHSPDVIRPFQNPHLQSQYKRIQDHYPEKVSTGLLTSMQLCHKKEKGLSTHLHFKLFTWIVGHQFVSYQALKLLNWPRQIPNEPLGRQRDVAPLTCMTADRIHLVAQNIPARDTQVEWVRTQRTNRHTLSNTAVHIDTSSIPSGIW